MEAATDGPTPGLRAQVVLTVTDQDTAPALGSGDVAVLATPRVLALAEAATVAAISGRLDPAQTSVGTSVQLRHSTPSPVGALVTATATLSDVEGHRLGFDVAVEQDGRLVASGRIERVVVDRQRFLSRLEER